VSKRRDAPVRVAPSLQNYAWGDPAFIPNVLGSSSAGTPVAEAWYGAHPKAPATVWTIEGAQPMDAWIRGMGHELPYLLKLLAAAQPLSIQVHPNATRAAAGFTEEEAAGIPIDAPHRRFRDPNHKPEVLVALSDFDALCGFRPLEEIEDALARMPEIEALLPSASSGIEALLRAWFARPDAEVHAALAAVMGRIATETPSPDTPEAWAIRAQQALGGKPDRGLLLVFMLELVHLEPGQAIFLPAGVPHAYLRGAGVELMASSDNVLRAGLTPKYVDPETLLEVVRFDAGRPVVLEPIVDESGREATWSIPATELDLIRWSLEAAESRSATAYGLETILVLARESNAKVEVESATGMLELGRGQACVVPDGVDYAVRASASIDVYRVRVPGGVEAMPTFRGRQPTALRFGTSGLRGLVSDITDLEAYVNTRGFLDVLVARGETVPGGQVALGGDLRPSTTRILRAVYAAVLDAGLRPMVCGRLPTPALTYFGLQQGIPSIMVTGSHIPFDRNGIKLVGPRGEVLKSDETDIVAAVERVRRWEYARSAQTSRFGDDGMFAGPAGELPPAVDDARRSYVQRYVDAFGSDALEGQRVVVYEHSAVGRDIVAEILRGLGADVVAMGRSDAFVAIDTEAIAPERIAIMQTLADDAIAAHGSIDAIVSTDGDSDRPMVLGIEDGRVQFINGDLLGAIVAEFLGADQAVVPVSCNDAVDRHLVPRGVPVVRTRIGSPYVIAGMQAASGERRVGWEANGGFLLGSRLELATGVLEPLPTRDAVLPIVAALSSAKRRGGSLVERVAMLPTRFGRAGLLDRVPREDSVALLEHFGASVPNRVEALRAHFTDARGFAEIESIDDTDGLRIHFADGDVAHVRPSGNAPQLRIYATADSETRAEAIVADALREPDGILRGLLGDARPDPFVDSIIANIDATTALFDAGDPPAVIGAVCGTAGARDFWQSRLEDMRPRFRARLGVAFHEDLPVNQALGLLLMWKRLSPQLQEGEGALVAFVFGDGTRATPLTEAEHGQKPAIESFVTDRSSGRRLSIVELAMRYFAPVEAYLRRSGFHGIVVKWGDEVQIPTLNLSGTDARFEQADVVRFVSMRTMDESSAANKDWVGVDAEGNVTAFIPRRPLQDMQPLADRGLLQRHDGQLVGGVNLGSIAVSRALLDALLAELEPEVDDPNADRKNRPDLDPQLFTALTVAAIPDSGARARAWETAQADSPAIAKLVVQWPDVLERLVRALARFEADNGRPIRIVAMDFGDQYWGDIGQHAKMYEFYMALRDPGGRGRIARALAGIEVAADGNGNLLVGDTRLGAGVWASDSVFVDAQIDEGKITGSVMIGTRCGRVLANEAFDVGSVATELRLGARGGSYKVVADHPVDVCAGQRCTTVFLPSGAVLLRADETTDLRDRASTYDVPILGNPIAFAEAHATVLAVDPVALERDRRTRQADVVNNRRRR